MLGEQGFCLGATFNEIGSWLLSRSRKAATSCIKLDETSEPGRSRIKRIRSSCAPPKARKIKREEYLANDPTNIFSYTYDCSLSSMRQR